MEDGDIDLIGGEQVAANDENAFLDNAKSWKRPLLYECKGKGSRRRRTETDLDIPKSLLVGDKHSLTGDAIQHDATKSEDCGSFYKSTENLTFLSKRRKRMRNREINRPRRQTVAVDGIYHARRAISVEQLSMSDESGNELEISGNAGETDAAIITDSEDEFFLATDFVNPLPRSSCTQSVDYLDSLVQEEGFVQQDMQRRYSILFYSLLFSLDSKISPVEDNFCPQSLCSM